MTEREFSCTAEGLAGAQAFLASVCESPKPAVVTDEIVSNIVRCSGAGAFTIRLDQAPEGFKMVFIDDGKAFDPTTEVATPDVATPDVAASAEGRGVGGLGIFMVKKMAKSVSYARQDGKNVLTVVM
ncbi:MAG: ATP-binding protein [Kiritimatiellae bacterium]|nr:ATP-binding protein [Kiritimatiellia bacterium]